MNLFHQVRASRHDPGDQIRMSGEVFRSGMHYEIDSELRRFAIDRSGKSAVDHGHEIVFPGDVYDFLKIDNPSQWIGGGFYIQEFRVFLDCALMLVVLRGVDEGCLDPKFGQPMREELGYPTINILLGDYVIATLKQGKN